MIFSRMTVCGDAWTLESEVNLALMGHTLRKYIVKGAILLSMIAWFHLIKAWKPVYESRYATVIIRQHRKPVQYVRRCGLLLPSE